MSVWGLQNWKYTKTPPLKQKGTVRSSFLCSPVAPGYRQTTPCCFALLLFKEVCPYLNTPVLNECVGFGAQVLQTLRPSQWPCYTDSSMASGLLLFFLSTKLAWVSYVNWVQLLILKSGICSEACIQSCTDFCWKSLHAHSCVCRKLCEVRPLTFLFCLFWCLSCFIHL